MTENTQNWAGNLTYRAARWHRPETVEQVQEIVAGSSRVKVLGTRHSFSDVADTSGDMISLAGLNKITHLDTKYRTVTVEAGVRYGDLARFLEAEGYALHNLASLPHISVAGACATATHGSGVGNGNLATAVVDLEMVNDAGGITEFADCINCDEVDKLTVGLGALGVVTQLKLRIEPTYQVRQVVYENLPLAVLLDDFGAIVSSAYSLSLFTDWTGPQINQVWLKHRDDAGTFQMPPTWNGATLATRKMHPIGRMPAENCTEQEGIPGPWHERLPHFKMEFTPSAGDELQSEYFVPRSLAPAALKALHEMREQIAPLLLISEIRTVAQDNLWMSPCYKQDSVGFHFTWKPDWPGVRALLPLIEERLIPFLARPHWGKLFVMRADHVIRNGHIHSLCPRRHDFRKLRTEYDPTGKFNNDFLTANLGAFPGEDR